MSGRFLAWSHTVDVGARQPSNIHPGTAQNPIQFGKIGGPPVAVGLAGIGRWGSNILRVLRSTPAFKLVGVADPRPVIHVEEDLRADITQLLATADLSAVVIATPSHRHFEHSVAALRSGRHVFVEKPLAYSADEADVLCDTADELGLQLMVGHILRYHPAILAIRQLIVGRDLGTVQRIRSERFTSRAMEEDFWWCLAPHDLSILEFVLNEELVSIARTDWNDRATAQVVTGTGILGEIQVGLATKHSMLSVWFEEGIVSYRGGDPHLLVEVRDNAFHLPLPTFEPLKIEMMEFVRCIQTGRSARSDGREGARVVRALAAGDWSRAHDGRWRDLS